MAPSSDLVEAATYLAALFVAAQECAAIIGLPVVVDDDEVHAALKAAGHNLPIVQRQRLASAAGFHPSPAERWKYSSDLHVLCTAPVGAHPQAMWDECIWLTPTRLLQQEITA